MQNVSSTQTPSVPALLPPSEPPKIKGSWLGQYIAGMMTRHEPPETLPDNPRCQRLVEEASAKSAQFIFADNKSSFFEGGKKNTETAITDVAIQIFTSLARKGATGQLSDEARIDHFVFTVLEIIKTEFETGGTNNQHFINIANTLLVTAYPKKEEDERLPSILRAIISDKWSLTRWAAEVATGKELSWEKLTEILASKLGEIYLSVNRAEQSQKAAAPEIKALVKDLVDRLDSSTKKSPSLQINAAWLSDESKAFLSSFLTRLLHNEFTKSEDTKLLEEAREWLLEKMKVSISAILYTIFAPRKGQTQQERNHEFTEEILSEASRVLPAVSQKITEIEEADASALQQMLCALNEDPTRQETKLVDEEMLKKWQGTSEEQQAARTLLKSVEMTKACHKIFSKQLQPAELQNLLPHFLSVETVIEQFYSMTSPYLTEIMMQFEAIEVKAEKARAALNPFKKDDSEFIELVDKILEQVQGSLEKKAVAESLKLSRFEAINEVICHLLKPTTASSEPAKNYINTQLKNLITIIFKEAIARKDPGLENPEKALAEIVNDALKTGRAAALRYAQEDSLDEQELLTRTSHEILEGIISKEVFDKLLPPFLKGNTFWNDTADLLAGKVLKGLFEQTKRAQEIAKKGDQKLQVAELKKFLDNIQKSILAQLEKPTEKDKGKVTNAVDRLTSSLLQGEGVKDLVREVLPNILEAILAYHVNPKEGTSSEERAAALAMNLLEIVQIGVRKVDDYESIHEESEKSSCLLRYGVTEEVLTAYRAKNDIPAGAPLDMRSFFFHQTAEKVLKILLPDDLLKQIIPEAFAGLQIEGFLADFTYNYIKEAYAYSRFMKQVTKPSDKTTQELVKYTKRLINNSFDSKFSKKQEDRWMKNVAGRVLASKDEELKLLDDFISNVLLGGIGFILKRDVTAEMPEDKDEDLTLLFLPIAKQAQEVFHLLNQPGSMLDPVDCYRNAAMQALETFFPEEKWEQLVPEIARSMFTKKEAADLLAGVYETLHQTQKVLEKEEKAAHRFMAKHPGLENYVGINIVDNLRETLIMLGQREEKLNVELPHSLDHLIKQILRGEDKDSAALRDQFLGRIVYSSLNEVMNTPESSVLDKFRGLVSCYQNNKGNAKTAEILLETIFSKELRNTSLVESVLTEDVKNSVAALIQQVRESQAKTLKRASEAKKYLHGLPGVKLFVDDMLLSINGTVDAMAEGKEKLSDGFPDYIDNQVKQLLSDKTLNPLAKEAIKQVIYIVLERIFKPSQGQKVEERVLEVMENLIRVYNAENPNKTGAAWLKELIPEETLKEILPVFLHESVTHEKLTEWFFLPYVEQVAKQKKEIEMENKKPLDENIRNAQAFAREFLLSYAMPTAPEKGLTGYSGEVRKIEGGLLGSLNLNANSFLAGMMKPYLDAVAAKAVRSLEEQGRLDSDFLSLALTEALPLLGGEGKIPADMPAKEQFVQESGKKLMEMIFPQGKNDVPVPEIAKTTVFEKARAGLESVIKEVTESESRVVWMIDRMIPFAVEDAADLKLLQKEAEEVRFQKKNPESLFKSVLQKAAILQKDLNMKKAGSWRITRFFARFLTRLFVFFYLRSRIYNFVSDSGNDDKFRAVIWSLLTFKKPTKAQSEDQIKNGLDTAAAQMLKGADILPGLFIGSAASGIASIFLGQNITDLLPGKR